MRLPDRSSGSASPRFSRQRRISAASSLPMMIRASEPPMKERRFSVGFVHTSDFILSLQTDKFDPEEPPHMG